MTDGPPSDDTYVPIIPNLGAMLADDADDALGYPISQEIRDTHQRYIAGDPLGKGGAKSVISASDLLTSREVAQAFLRDANNPGQVEAFFREARLTASLQHPNIVPLYDVGLDDDNQPFFVMKRIDGQTLADLIREGTADSATANLRMLMECFVKICDAVAFAHSRGVIHLDLKPDNIHLGEYGEVLVADWGLAKVIGSGDEEDPYYDEDLYGESTLHGMLKGTPGYMAPEQIDPTYGDKNQQTDIYALGAILYSLLAKRAPNRGSNMEQTLANTLRGVSDLSSALDKQIPDSLDAIAMKALSVEQAKRYQRVEELRADINSWQEGFATSAEDYHFFKAASYLLKRHKQVAMLLAILVLSTIGFLIWVVAEKQETDVQRTFALTQKQEAQHALQLYQAEQVERERISREGSPRLIQLARSNIDDFKYDDALKNLNLALAWAPDHEEARLYRGLCLFYSQQFTEAIEVLSHATQYGRGRKKSMALAQKYRVIKGDRILLPADDLIQLLEDSKAVFVTPVKVSIVQKAAVHLANYAYQQDDYSLEEKMRIAQEAMTRVHPGDKGAKMTAEIVDGKLHLDLSSCSKSIALNPLAMLPVSQLDISHKILRDAEILSYMPLVALVIVDCEVPFGVLRSIPTLKRITVGQELFPPLHKSGIEIIRR